MLIEPDKNELGDKRLNPEEAVKKEREALLQLASRFKIPGQDELADPDRSSGPKMPWQELVFRLQKLNPKLQAKNSNVHGVPTIAIYYPKTESEKLNDGSYFEVAITEKQKFHRDNKYVAGFDRAFLPQYSHVLTDTSGLPTREVRGVMTVLLMLVRAGVLTHEQIKQEFQDPANDQRSGRYFEQTRKERNA